MRLCLVGCFFFLWLLRDFEVSLLCRLLSNMKIWVVLNLDVEEPSCAFGLSKAHLFLSPHMCREHLLIKQSHSCWLKRGLAPPQIFLGAK